MLSTKVREPVTEGNEDTGSDFVLLVLHKINESKNGRYDVTGSPRSYSYHFRFLATSYFFLLESIKKQTQKGHNDVLQMLNIDSATRKAHHRFKNVPFEAKHFNLMVGKQQAKTSWQR